MEKESCFTCKNASISPADFSVGIMGEYVDDCRADLLALTIDELDNIDWEEEKCPEICQSYDPIMVETCPECKRQINLPLKDIEFFGDAYEAVPLCSDQCRKEFNKKFT